MSLPTGVGSSIMSIVCGALTGNERKVRVYTNMLITALEEAKEVDLARRLFKVLRDGPGQVIVQMQSATQPAKKGEE